jgi:DNA-binding winged helix-turn-helix (wHTH) protein
MHIQLGVERARIAEPPGLSGGTLRFRRYSLTPGARVLLRDQQPVAIGDRAFDLIYVLASTRGQVVERSDLMRRVWPTTVVDECNLRFQVKCARRALGEDRDLIKSVAGRGYFFVDETEQGSDARGGGTSPEAGNLRSPTSPSYLPPDPAGVQSPEDYRASCELLRELLTSVLQELWRLRGTGHAAEGLPGVAPHRLGDWMSQTMPERF